MSTSTSLNYAELFELCDPLASRPLRLGTKGYSDWLAKEQASALFRGELKLQYPLQLGAYMGGQATDFLWSSLTPLLVVSQKVVGLLEECRLTGWATYPVEVYDRKGDRLEGYSGFAITGRAGKRNRSRSRIITKPAPAPGGRSREVYKGLYFDEGQWDGSDIFLVGGIKVVTRPLQQALKQAKVTNVRFTPLPDVEILVYLDRFDPEAQEGKH